MHTQELMQTKLQQVDNNPNAISSDENLEKLRQLLNISSLREARILFTQTALKLRTLDLSKIIYYLENYPDEISRIRHTKDNMCPSQAVIEYFLLYEKSHLPPGLFINFVKATKGRYDLLQQYYSYYLDSNQPLTVDFFQFLSEHLPLGKMILFDQKNINYFDEYFVPLIINRHLFLDKLFRQQLRAYLKSIYANLDFDNALYEIIQQPGCILLRPDLNEIFTMAKNNVVNMFQIPLSILTLLNFFKSHSKISYKSLVDIIVLATNGVLSYSEQELQTMICKLPCIKEKYIDPGQFIFFLNFDNTYYSGSDIKFFNQLFYYAFYYNPAIEKSAIIQFAQWLKKLLHISQLEKLTYFPQLSKLTMYYHISVRRYFDKAVDEQFYLTDSKGKLINEMDLFNEIPVWLLSISNEMFELINKIHIIQLLQLNTQAGLILSSPIHAPIIINTLRANGKRSSIEQLIAAFFVTINNRDFRRSELILKFLMSYPFLCEIEFANFIHVASDETLHMLSDITVTQELIETLGHNNPEIIIKLLTNNNLSRTEILCEINAIQIQKSNIPIDSILAIVVPYLSRDTLLQLRFTCRTSLHLFLDHLRRTLITKIQECCSDFCLNNLAFLQAHHTVETASIQLQSLQSHSNDMQHNPIVSLLLEQIYFLNRLFNSLQRNLYFEYESLISDLPQNADQKNIIILLLIKEGWKNFFQGFDNSHKTPITPDYYKNFRHFIVNISKFLIIRDPISLPINKLLKSIFHFRHIYYYFYPGQFLSRARQYPFIATLSEYCKIYILGITANHDKTTQIVVKSLDDLLIYRIQVNTNHLIGPTSDIKNFTTQEAYNQYIDYQALINDSKQLKAIDDTISSIFYWKLDFFDIRTLNFFQKYLYPSITNLIKDLLEFMQLHFSIIIHPTQCELDFILDQHFQDAVINFSNDKLQRLNLLKQLQTNSNQMFSYRLMFTHPKSIILSKQIPPSKWHDLFNFLPSKFQTIKVSNAEYYEFFSALTWALQYFNIDEIIAMASTWQEDIRYRDKFTDIINDFYFYRAQIQRLVNPELVTRHNSKMSDGIKVFLQNFPTNAYIMSYCQSHYEEYVKQIFSFIGQNFIHLIDLTNDQWDQLLYNIIYYYDAPLIRVRPVVNMLPQLLVSKNIWHLTAHLLRIHENIENNFFILFYYLLQKSTSLITVNDLGLANNIYKFALNKLKECPPMQISKEIFPLLIAYPIEAWRESYEKEGAKGLWVPLCGILQIDRLNNFFQKNIFTFIKTGNYIQNLSMFFLRAPDYLWTAIYIIAKLQEDESRLNTFYAKIINSFLIFCNRLTLEELVTLSKEDIDFLLGNTYNHLLLINIMTLAELKQFNLLANHHKVRIIKGLSSHFNYEGCRIIYHRINKIGFNCLSLNKIAILFSAADILTACAALSDDAFYNNFIPKLIALEPAEESHIDRLLGEISLDISIKNFDKYSAEECIPTGTAEQLRLFGINEIPNTQDDISAIIPVEASDNEIPVMKQKSPAAN